VSLDKPDAGGEPIAAKSVYQRALGNDFGSLEPHLQSYFGPIPAGRVGTGHGAYDLARSRLRFLRPFLALVAKRHVLFPELGHDVPFSIINTPGSDGSLSAIRTFEFPERTRVMEDTMTVVDGQLIDRIGKRRGLEIATRLGVVAGALHMTSTRLALRAGPLRIPLPPLATMHLVERTDPVDPSRQRVDVRINAPRLGEVFRYTGGFTYTIRTAAADESLERRPPAGGAKRTPDNVET
jgi:hypothetical protein